MDLLMDEQRRTFDFTSDAGYVPEAQSFALFLEGLACRTALQAVRLARAGSFFVIAINCNSFCLPCRDCLYIYCLICHFTPSRSAGSHERSLLFPYGNKGYGFVSKGNCIAARVVGLIVFILSKGGRFLMEQPAQSYLIHHKAVAWLFDTFCIWQTNIWGGKYADNPAEASAKRHVLWSNDKSLLRELALAAGTLSREDRALFGKSLVKKRARDDGTSSWSGNGALKASQRPVLPNRVG